MYVGIQDHRVFTNMKDWIKLTGEMCSHIVEKVAVLGLGLLFK